MSPSTASCPSPTTSRRARRGLSALVVVAALVLGACMSPQQRVAYDLVNSSRSNSGVHALAHDAIAQAKAQAWAEHLASKNTLAHSRLRDGMDGGAGRLGENVGYGSSIESVHRQFTRSRTHLANIVDSRFTHVGVGVARGHGHTFVVQVFVQR